MEHNRGQWSSSFGFLMAAIGSAVGLGNIWGFPYKMGANGGGAFLLVYVLLVIFVGFVVMLGELAIGRKTGKGAVDAYRALNRKLPWIGYMGVGSAFLILGFYCVLGGMVLRYMFGFFANLIGLNGFAAGEGFFGEWVANMPGMVGYYALFMLLTVLIVMGGISGGIEKFSKVAMPALAVMLVTVIIYVACQPGAAEGYRYMFVPDFSVFDSLSSFFRVLKYAAGQMFFSLSLGMGIMITYGSYLSKKEDLNSNALIIPIADTTVAIMAGMAVMPACAAFGMEYAQGPGLLFKTLQTVFMDGMGGFIGNLMGFLFYTLVFIAAITSSISLLEVNTTYLIDRRMAKGKSIDRKKITIFAALVIFIVGLPTAIDGLGTNVAGGAWIDCPAVMFGLPSVGATADWLDFYDMIAEGLMMPLASLAMTIVVGWIYGTGMIKQEVECCGHKYKGEKFYHICFRYIVPVIMVVVLYAQIQTFFGI